ncbi:MAG: HAD-IA family hydrolase [Spirochaetaceae bacterium]|nr:HAD-IA family hydrolase [Spirochaetaceae bacterium]
MLTDFDGVVRHWPPDVTASIEDRHGLPRGSLEKTAFDPSFLDDAITGRLTDSEWRSEVARRLAAQTDAATARSAVAAWSTGRGVVDTAALRVLQAARSASALGLVTNATTRLEDDLARLSLSDAFDLVVNSSAVGCAKPSRCFHEHAARRCGCERGAVLFVDDRPENVEAAIAFGFHGHLYRDPETLRRLLRDWNLRG